MYPVYIQYRSNYGFTALGSDRIILVHRARLKVGKSVGTVTVRNSIQAKALPDLDKEN
jgi:hypothetical protein